MTKYKSDKKFRQVEIIIYQEHWLDELDLWNEIDYLRARALLSPLHDKDVIEKGKDKGKLKKPHWHLLLFFDSTKSLNQVEHLSGIFNDGADNLYKEIISVGGAVSYLSHKNSPNKAQYDELQVKEFGGARYEDLLREKISKYPMILKIIRENEIKSQKELTNFLLDSDREYLLDEVAKRSYALSKIGIN